MRRSAAAAVACRNDTDISPALTIQLLFKLSVSSSLSTLYRCARIDVVNVSCGFSEPFCYNACSESCSFVAQDPPALYDVLLWCQCINVYLCVYVLLFNLLYLLLDALCSELLVESFCVGSRRIINVISSLVSHLSML